MTQLRTEADRRAFVESSCRFDSVTGAEAPHQEWFRDRLADFGFETYTWTGDAERLADHPSFPDDPAEIDTADRPSVGGVLSFGDPDAGPTLVLNGHCDVVPVDRESWSSPPFEPTWDEAGERLTCRGAADMKAGLGACVAAALALRERVDRGETESIDGRVVVESVVDEEAGGIGAATAALSNPYPFERDAVVVAEPTELRPVTATEGSLMKRLRLRGRSAHAATRWRGESVLPHFRAIHEAVEAFGAERAETVTHPLYERFDDPWPVNVGHVEAGSWASSVPATLTAEFRIGVAPGESVAAVEAAVDERVAAVAAERPWLADHPPTFERFSVQFEPAETDPDAPVVRHLRDAMGTVGLEDTEPVGATYGADSRHYVAAGIPAVCFGPGSIEQAHFPDEHVAWREVETARAVLVETAARFLVDGG
ncbi:M20/M25/M40 family metallo-hydrolase [Halobaculum sp. MBLA0147]|uniref:M20/M25/M40 family metallo-hydrolase n=1 Tax=Halobaculum sp. MBLA0147 TaxID=3079934 RepID=UPI0035262E1C